jgi:hypothetical protein
MAIFYLDPVLGVDTAGAPYDTPYGWWCVAYTGGSGTAPVASGTAVTDSGEVVTGVTSTQTAKVSYVTVTSGTWAGNNAAGMMYFYNMSGTFTAGETCNCAVSGHFEITTSFTYCAWKTITSGATAARIAPGDTIRMRDAANDLPGSATYVDPGPTSLGHADWANDSAIITLETACTANISTCETVHDTPTSGSWHSDQANANATANTAYKEGSFCVNIAVVAAFATGIANYCPTGTLNLAGYQQISFWIYSDVAIAANSLRVDLCTDNAGATPANSFTIPYKLEAARWYPATFNNAGALSGAVESVALNVLIDLGATTCNIRLDNIFAHNGFSLASLIGKNTTGETFWTIKNINGTSVELSESQQTGVSHTHYWGIAEHVTAYRRETVKTVLATASTTSVQTVQDSGTYSNSITYSGGWSRVTNTQTGVTWFDGTMGWGWGISRQQNSIYNYVGVSRYYSGLAQYTANSVFNYCYLSGNNYYGIFSQGSALINNNYCIFSQNTNSGFACGGYGTDYRGKYLSNSYGICTYGLSTQLVLEATFYGSMGYDFFYNSGAGKTKITLENCNKLPSIVIGTGTGYPMVPGLMVIVAKNCTGASDITYINYGKGTIVTYTLIPDTAIFRTTSPSLRLTANHATYKAESAPLDEGMKATVASGSTLTVSVYVRTSLLTDTGGANYNGAAPRLIVRRNDAVGYTADAVIATHAGAAGEWTLLSGTTSAATSDGVMEFVVDSDGTAGWINIDDWQTTQGGANIDGRQKYWFQGLPFQGLTPPKIISRGGMNGGFS